MMEGIFVCAAPRCLKSFLTQSDFGAHIYENHADLFQSNKEDEDDKELRASSMDTQIQPSMQVISTSCAPTQSGVSPSLCSQHQDHEEKFRHNQSNDQLARKAQAKPLPFHSHQQRPADNKKADNNAPLGFDRPNNWMHQPQSFENQAGPFLPHLQTEKPVGISLQPPLSNRQQMHIPQQSSYPRSLNANQTLPHQLVGHPPFPVNGSQTFYGAPFEFPRAEMVPAGTPGQGLQFPLNPAGLPGFVGNVPQTWGMRPFGMPFDPQMMMSRGISDGYNNQADSH